MKTSIKTLQDVSGLHDVRTYTGAVRKSGKPALPTTAILDLYMRRSERDRIVNELKRLKRRRRQLRRRLTEIEKEMTKLLSKATQTAHQIRGSSAKTSLGEKSEKKGKTILRY